MLPDAQAASCRWAGMPEKRSSTAAKKPAAKKPAAKPKKEESESEDEEPVVKKNKERYTSQVESDDSLTISHTGGKIHLFANQVECFESC